MSEFTTRRNVLEQRRVRVSAVAVALQFRRLTYLPTEVFRRKLTNSGKTR